MTQIINAVDEPRVEDLRWWADVPDAHERLFAAKDRMWDEDGARRKTELHHLRMYDSSFAHEVHNDIPVSPATFQPDIRLQSNVCKSVVETATSRIGKNKPRAQFLPRGGSFSILKQSKRLSKYVEGVFEEADVYHLGRQAFRHGAIGGTGILRFFPKRKKKGWGIGCELVFPWELIVDALDGRQAKPRTIIHVRYMDKSVLFEKYKRDKRWKGKEEELAGILAHASEGELKAIGRDSATDTVEVLEAYRLPSVAGGDDGKHVIGVSSGILFEEEWDEDWFPYAVFRWNPGVLGYWGSGVIKIVTPQQVHINKFLRTIAKSYHIHGAPILALPRGAQIPKDQLSNRFGLVVRTADGQMPTLITHKPVHDQMINVLQMMKNDAFDESGVSQLAALNRKPAELESGEALRQFNDISDARHADPALNYEKMYMEGAKIVVGLSRRMHKRGMTPAAMAPFRRRFRSWVEPIKWDDIEFAEDQFALQVYPTSILPSLPAGRTATIQEWLRAGFIDKETAHFMLEIPDLDSYGHPDLVMYEAVLDDVERMLDEGEARVPEPFQNPILTQKLAGAAYLRARQLGAPEDRLLLMLDYLQANQRMLLRAQQAQQAQNPAGVGPNNPQAPAPPNLATLQSPGVPQ
ncbi:MAG: hypothetical protein AAGE52_38670 [Myxococcota bacterium]